MGENILDPMRDLIELGYLHAPEVRSFGGPYALRNPITREIVWEDRFADEVEEALMGNRKLLPARAATEKPADSPSAKEDK